MSPMAKLWKLHWKISHNFHWRNGPNHTWPLRRIHSNSRTFSM